MEELCSDSVNGRRGGKRARNPGSAKTKNDVCCGLHRAPWKRSTDSIHGAGLGIKGTSADGEPAIYVIEFFFRKKPGANAAQYTVFHLV